jgi:hypothetical protein
MNNNDYKNPLGDNFIQETIDLLLECSRPIMEARERIYHLEKEKLEREIKELEKQLL